MQSHRANRDNGWEHTGTSVSGFLWPLESTRQAGGSCCFDCWTRRVIDPLFCAHVPLVQFSICFETWKVAITKHKGLGTTIYLAFIHKERASRRRRRNLNLKMPPRLSCAASMLASTSRATTSLRTCHSRVHSNYLESTLISKHCRVRLRSRGEYEKSFSPGDGQRVSSYLCGRLSGAANVL